MDCRNEHKSEEKNQDKNLGSHNLMTKFPLIADECIVFSQTGHY
jgi:hypothetical protein